MKTETADLQDQRGALLSAQEQGDKSKSTARQIADIEADLKRRNAPLAQIDKTPMRDKLADPDFVAWAKKNGRTPTDAARCDYDSQQITALTNGVAKNWIRGIKHVAHANHAEVPGGSRMQVLGSKKRGDFEGVVPKSERAGLYGTINKEISEYSARHGESPLSNGSFTSNAYYIYDIIDGKPTNVRRYEINDKNREIIQRFDKQYKSEVYKGAEYASHVLAKFWRENGGLPGNSSRTGNGKAAVPNALVDVKAGVGAETLPGAKGDNGGLQKGVETGAGRSRRFLYSKDGRVVGWYDGKAKEIHTLPGTDAGTVAHELGWHATYDHAQERAASDDRTLLDKLNKYAEDAKRIVVDPATGRTLEQEITARYGARGVTDPSVLLDEIGAARYTMENVGKIKDAAARRQAAKWYGRAWNAITDAYKSMMTKMGFNKGL